MTTVLILSCIIGVCFLCVVCFFLGVGWHVARQEELREARQELEHYKVFFGDCVPCDSEVVNHEGD